MGQMYAIGLQAGKEVAKAVDEFIAVENKGEYDNFNPINRKELVDGSVIYRWYLKWQPSWYKDEKRFVAVLHRFEDDVLEDGQEDEYYYDRAYKLVAVGDEGGQDEIGNETGFDMFDGLYNSCSISFPESFESPEMAEENEDLKAVTEAYSNGDRYISSDYMAELLFDPNWSTWKMFEGLAEDYIDGNADVRAGIDKAVSALTGWKLSSIAKVLIDRNKEAETA